MLLSLLSIPLLGSLASVSAAPSIDLAPRDGSVNVGFPYGQEKVRGVNLGGWLVLGMFCAVLLADKHGVISID